MTDDICANNHGGNQQSAEAHSSILGDKACQQKCILAYALGQGAHGMTCEEAEITLGGRHQSISARVSELKRDGWLIETKMRRPTRSGRKAAVLWHRQVDQEFRAVYGLPGPEK